MPDVSHPVRLSDVLIQWRPDWLTAVLVVGLVLVVVRA